MVLHGLSRDFSDGETMSTPMTFAEYCRLPGVNHSTLKLMAKSPLHYKDGLETEDEDSDDMMVGRAAHTAVFEPDRFLKDYALYSKRRDGKEWDAFKSLNVGKTILTDKMFYNALRIRDAVRENPIAKPYLNDGKAEVSLQFDDPETLIPCKARLDWISQPNNVLVDLKTSHCVDPWKFGKTGADLFYHSQMAFYLRALRANKYVTPDFAIIIAVENTRPHDVVVMEVDSHSLRVGDDLCSNWLHDLSNCLASGKWPGQADSIQRFMLPIWAGGRSPEDDIEEGWES